MDTRLCNVISHRKEGKQEKTRIHRVGMEGKGEWKKSKSSMTDSGGHLLGSRRSSAEWAIFCTISTATYSKNKDKVLMTAQTPT